MRSKSNPEFNPYPDDINKKKYRPYPMDDQQTIQYMNDLLEILKDTTRPNFFSVNYKAWDFLCHNFYEVKSRDLKIDFVKKEIFKILPNLLEILGNYDVQRGVTEGLLDYNSYPQKYYEEMNSKKEKQKTDKDRKSYEDDYMKAKSKFYDEFYGKEKKDKHKSDKENTQKQKHDKREPETTPDQLRREQERVRALKVNVDKLIEENIDPYLLLSIDKKATPPQIRRAYKATALKNHPDKKSNPEEKSAAESMIKKINLAYEILSDPQARQYYDSKVTRSYGYR
ncbi:MAG: J domain-containing protein [Gammaproteobacteria bacterium]